MKAHLNKNEHEKFNLILAYDPGTNTDKPMLTVGKVEYGKGKIRALNHITGEEATKLYNQLIGEDKNAV